MPVGELVDTIVAAEELGYEWCQVADEGLMADVWVALGAAAGRTSTIRLGAATNGYTRHPAATAAAAATLDELSAGRAFVTLVAGGSMVLAPMGIERRLPATVVAETIEIMRRLWSGEQVTWQGRVFGLEGARLAGAGGPIPVMVAARGERMLEIAGRLADGVVLMAKADLGAALDRVEAVAGARMPTRVYLDRLVFDDAMLEEAKTLYTYAVMDSPDRMLASLGLDELSIRRLRTAMAAGGPAAAAALITPDMLARYQITGTRSQCRVELAELIAAHHLDMFMMNIISSGLAANLGLLTEVRSIVRP
jgi:5,10-methylenetetrahydromethanopterin reductase